MNKLAPFFIALSLLLTRAVFAQEHEAPAHVEHGAAHDAHGAAAHNEHANAEHGAHGGHGDTSINWWGWDMHTPPMGWFLLDFAVFAGGLAFILRKPLRKAFQKRHELIKNAVEENTKALEDAQSKFDTTHAKLSKVNSEAAELLAQMKKAAQEEQQKIVAAAQNYAERLKSDAQGMMGQEGRNAKERLRVQLSQQILKTAQGIVQKEINDADRQKLLDLAIADIESEEAASAPRRRATAGRAKKREGDGDAA